MIKLWADNLQTEKFIETEFIWNWVLCGYDPMLFSYFNLASFSG